VSSSTAAKRRRRASAHSVSLFSNTRISSYLGWLGGGTLGGSNSISASQRQPISIACFMAARPDMEWKMPTVVLRPRRASTACSTRSRSRLNWA
jgi:hypothetical protein